MYAHLVLFTVGPGKRQVAEEIADRFAPIYESVPSCKGAVSYTHLTLPTILLV